MPPYLKRPIGWVLAVATISAAGVAMTVQGHSPTAHQPHIDSDTTTSAERVKRGAYLARAADCMACHTREGASDAYAGGRPIESPFGTIYATNITPAPKAAPRKSLIQSLRALSIS